MHQQHDYPTHSLTRTSPKGTRFLGRCIRCGKTNLPSAAAKEPCENHNQLRDAPGWEWFDSFYGGKDAS